MKEVSGGEEKRKFRRIKEKFPIKLQVYSRGRPAAYGKYEAAFLQDISAGGALFNYSKKLEIGTFVELVINMGTLPEPVKCLGKVIRAEPSAQPKTPGEKPPLYNIALRFIETADKKEEELLRKAIEEYYSRQRNNKR